jgi:hypothetical protein
MQAARKNITQRENDPSQANSRPRPAVQRGLRYLDGFGSERPEKSIACMAAEAGVSYVSMWKAVQSRPRPREKERGTAAAASVKSSHARVRDSVKADLLSGRLPLRGFFPQIKELQTRYDAGFRTVKAALEDLRSRGRLLRQGRSYYAKTNDRPSMPSLRIGVLVYNWNADRPFALFSQYEEYFVRDLELECWRRNIDIELLPYYHHDKTTIVQSLHQKISPDPGWHKRFDGLAVLVMHVNCLKGDLAAQLQVSGKPVVLVDEISGWTMPDYLGKTRRALHLHARPFRNAAEAAGREIIAHGHQRVAYFSAFHHDIWSRQCLEGLSFTIQQAGGSAPKAFLEYGSQTESGFDYTERARSSPIYRRIRECYARCRTGMSAPYAIQLDPFFSSLFDEHLVYAETRDVMEKHFAAAIVDKRITCWVAADHDMAMYVGDYLRAHRPELSLVSFGTSTVIANNRISTVDFNAPAAARATVEFLLYPQRKLPGQSGMKLEIQVIVVNRGSLRPI